MSRIACIFVPLFPLAARLRSEPELASEAVALFEGNGNAAHVVAATRRARKHGVRPGMTLAQSRAILPKLVARSRDAACERAAQEALFEAAEQFSPRIEDHGDGVVYLDIDGMEHLFKGDDPERDLAKSLIRRVDAAGLPGRVGIAGSKLAARVAAELPKSPNIIREGEESQFLAPLPLSRLSPEMEIATILQKWGLTSIGELARLPEAEVASRLGELGRMLHYAARGIDPEPLIPKQPPPDFREGMDLEWPIVTLEPFIFVANAALDRLMQRMATLGYACTRIDVSLRLEPDGFHERGITLPAPTRDVKTLLTLIRLDLEAAPPGAPVAGFVLIAHPDAPRQGQLSLFGPPAMSHDRLTTTIAKIASVIGEDRIGCAATVDGHRPERYSLHSFDPPPPPRMRREPKKARGLLAVRVLRPPVPLDVTDEGRLARPASQASVSSRAWADGQEGAMSSRACAEGREGRGTSPAPNDVSSYPPRTEDHYIAEPRACYIARPEADLMQLQLRSVKSLESRKARVDYSRKDERPVSTTPRPEIEGSIRVASGPWTLEEGWWCDSPVERDYWDIELTNGGVYRIYRERETGKWFADGMYD